MPKVSQTKKLSLFFICLTILITIFISDCSKTDKKILKQEKFVKILADMLVIENLGISENEKSALMQKVFQKHHTDQQTFKKTREYFKKDPKYWIKVYSSAKDLISAQADSISRTNKISNHEKK
jgi:hypothetical protein